MIDFKTEIEAMRQSFLCDHKKAMKLPNPRLRLVVNEIWRKNYEELPMLTKTGCVCYASFVQANENLFKYSMFSTKYVDNAPAAIIFSTDKVYDENPLKLRNIADVLFRYKGTNAAPENLKIITDAITDERQYLYNVKLPDDLSNKTDIFYTTIIVYRQHIPEKRITGLILPVVVEPNDLQSTMILPKQYWTSKFVDFNKGNNFE